MAKNSVKKWDCTVIRMGISFHSCQVEARTKKEAMVKAVESAVNTRMTEKDVDYNVEYCEKVVE